MGAADALKPRAIAHLIVALSLLARICPEAAALSQANAVALERGPAERRLSTLVEILRVPPEQREPAIWKALEREANRMLEWRRRPGRVSEEEGEINSADSAGLVRALGQSENPAMIPLLIEYSGGVSYAADALIRFGGLVVPALVCTIEDSVDDLDQVEGATSILGELLRQSTRGTITPLTDAHREQIAGLAQELLDTKFKFGNIVGITALAIATGRADLRDALEQLASDRDAWVRRGITDSFLVDFGQRIIKGQLKKTPRP